MNLLYLQEIWKYFWNIFRHCSQLKLLLLFFPREFIRKKLLKFLKFYREGSVRVQRHHNLKAVNYFSRKTQEDGKTKRKAQMWEQRYQATLKPDTFPTCCIYFFPIRGKNVIMKVIIAKTFPTTKRNVLPHGKLFPFFFFYQV